MPDIILQLQQIDNSLQPKTRPRVTAPDTPLALGTSLLLNMPRRQSQDMNVDNAGATSVMEACLSRHMYCIAENQSDLRP